MLPAHNCNIAFSRVHELSSFLPAAQWFRTAKNRAVSTGPLASLVAHLLALLTHFFARSLTHSLPSSWENEWLDVSKKPGFVPQCLPPRCTPLFKPLSFLSFFCLFFRVLSFIFNLIFLSSRPTLNRTTVIPRYIVPKSNRNPSWIEVSSSNQFPILAGIKICLWQMKFIGPLKFVIGDITVLLPIGHCFPSLSLTALIGPKRHAQAGPCPIGPKPSESSVWDD